MSKIQINNITVTLSEDNSCHETLDKLICDVCNKAVEHVYALKSKQQNDTRFACLNGECFPELLKQMLLLYDDEYLLSCRITDASYATKKKSKKRARAEMTLKLRYQIMKRDYFKCVICGRRPPDVELCVDHIIPVSRGGKSKESNLRTLCTDCNFGKGAD